MNPAAIGIMVILASLVVALLILAAVLDRIALLRKELESEKSDNVQLRALLRSRGVSPPYRGARTE